MSEKAARREGNTRYEVRCTKDSRYEVVVFLWRKNDVRQAHGTKHCFFFGGVRDTHGTKNHSVPKYSIRTFVSIHVLELKYSVKRVLRFGDRVLSSTINSSTFSLKNDVRV